MTVREYIGARYVPVFADPIQWDNTLSYEPLTVVTDNGTSYVSRQSVPPGTAIDNESYWVRWADYNAQLEEYIRQVQTYSASISALNDALPIADFDANDTVKDAIDDLGALLPTSAFDSTNTVDARFDVIEADSWVSTNRIADSAVTSGKIADGAVTSAKIADSTIVGADIANNTIPKTKLIKDLVLIFGDSWSDFAGGFENWATHMSDMLGCDYQSFAEGGTTWTSEFPTQVATAYNTLSAADKARVSAIVCIGGVNDLGRASSVYATGYNNIVTGATNFKEQCDTYFPNVPIYGGINAGLWAHDYTNERASKMIKIANALETSDFPAIGIIPIRNLIWNVYCVYSGYRADNLHPSADGAKKIGALVASTIQGSGIDAVASVHINSFALTSNLTITGFDFNFKNGTFEFRPVKFVTGSSAAAGDIQVPDTGWGWFTRFLKLRPTGSSNYLRLFNATTGNGNGWANISKEYISVSLPASTTGYCNPLTIDYNNPNF